MINLAQYLEHQYKNRNEHIEDIREYNKVLIEKYPWLEIKRWDDFDPYPEDNDDNIYDYTWLDDMPEGWRIAFGDQMCKDIQDELERVNFVDEMEILQIKEKYGGLRFYTGGVPTESKIFDIVRKYEDLSYETCIKCGKPAEWISTGWISPYCNDCKEASTYGVFKRIEE